MPGAPQRITSAEEQAEFATIWASPDHLGMSIPEIMEKFQCTRQTLYNVARRDSVQRLIKGERADKIIAILPAVDAALMTAAKGGDVRAIELLYERWDDYTRKSKSQFEGFVATDEDSAEKMQRKESVKKFIAEVIKNKNQDDREDGGGNG